MLSLTPSLARVARTVPVSPRAAPRLSITETQTFASKAFVEVGRERRKKQLRRKKGKTTVEKRIVRGELCGDGEKCRREGRGEEMMDGERRKQKFSSRLLKEKLGGWT